MATIINANSGFTGTKRVEVVDEVIADRVVSDYLRATDIGVATSVYGGRTVMAVFPENRPFPATNEVVLLVDPISGQPIRLDVSGKSILTATYLMFNGFGPGGVGTLAAGSLNIQAATSAGTSAAYTFNSGVAPYDAAIAATGMIAANVANGIIIQSMNSRTPGAGALQTLRAGRSICSAAVSANYLCISFTSAIATVATNAVGSMKFNMSVLDFDI